MDFKINNKQEKQNLSFTGMKSLSNQENKPVLQFSPPPHSKDETVTLEIVPYIKNKPFDAKNAQRKSFKENSLIEIPSEPIKSRFDGVAYRFLITNNKTNEKYYVTDAYEKIYDKDETPFNVIKTSDNFGYTPKTGTMRHSYLDSDVVLEIEKGKLVQKPTILDSNRNHTNKLGGSIKGLDYLLCNTDQLDPYRYIISTPDIGVDPTSSHKYWPNNLYQCSNMQDFKDLNFHLFERGKGYVADGAFTSQSLQSPLVQHALKWGEKSPWYKMLKLEDHPVLGILPNDSKARKHVGVKIVNNPNDKKNYDKNKPTYIQFYDDRLASDKLQNSNEVFEAYDKFPSDRYEITSNEDSIYPFSFEISLDDKEQIKAFKNTNHILLKDLKNQGDFLTFAHFSVNDRHNAASATFWDGQRDLVKLNLSNSDDLEAMENARSYIWGVADFWTEAVQSDFILRTAKLSDSEKAEIANKNEVDYQQLKSSLDSTPTPVLQQNKTPQDYLEQFPLQSIETSPELSAIFAQPDFNKTLLSQDTKSKILSQVESTIDNAIPEKYKNNEEYKAYVTKTYANEIIKYLYAQALNKNSVNSKGEIDSKELKKVTLKSIVPYEASTPKVEMKQVANKIQSAAKQSDLSAIQSKIKKELENVTLNDFKLADSIVHQGRAGLNWRFDAAKDVGDLDSVRSQYKNFKDVWDGEYGVEGFWKGFIKNVRKYNPSSYIINEITDFWDFYDGENEKIQRKFDSNNYNPDVKEANYHVEAGSTTSSNYVAYFNKLSCFIGTNPEELGMNNPVSRAGNIEDLKDCTTKFVTANQPMNVLLSHTFNENHDKPRILHTLPLNIHLFLANKIEGNSEFEKTAKEVTGSTEYRKMSPKAVEVARVMLETIDKSNFSTKEKEELKKSVRLFALGKKEDSSPIDFKRAEAFAVTPYEVSFRDIIKKAGVYKNEKDLDEKTLDLHNLMLKDSMIQQSNLWQVINAIVGTPTLYNGAEFAQTGFETPFKNVFFSNRYQILHNLKNDKRYKAHYEKTQAISGMYLLPNLSAIRDGDPIFLESISTGKNSNLSIEKYEKECADKNALKYFIDNIPNVEKLDKMFEKYDLTKSTQQLLKEGIGHDIENTFGINNGYGSNWKNFVDWYKLGDDGFFKKAMETKELIEEEKRNKVDMMPIYKYDNKGSRVIQFVTNYDVPKGQLAYQKEGHDEPQKIKSLSIKDDKGRCPFEEGTILKRKVYKNGLSYSDETLGNTKSARTYIVKNGEIQAVDGKDIVIDDTVLTFYKDKNQNGTKIA